MKLFPWKIAHIAFLTDGSYIFYESIQNGDPIKLECRIDVVFSSATHIT